METYINLTHIQLLFLVIAMAITIYSWYQERTKSHLVLALLLIFLASHISISAIMPEIRTLPIWNYILKIFILIEAAAYYLIFYLLLKRKPFKKFILYWFLGFVLFSLISILYTDFGSSNYSTYSFMIGNIGLLIGSLFYFNELFRSGINPFKEFWFWIILGHFLFLAIDIPFTAMIKYLQSSPTFARYELELYCFFVIIGALYYLLYIPAILCKTKK